MTVSVSSTFKDKQLLRNRSQTTAHAGLVKLILEMLVLFKLLALG